MLKKLAALLLVITLLFLAAAAAEEAEPGWTADPYDETNRVWQWHFGDLTLRIPGFYEVRGTAKSVIASTIYYEFAGVMAHGIRIEHVVPDAKLEKTLKQFEKKEEYDNALSAVIEAEYKGDKYDKKLGGRIWGTPEEVIVYRTPQITGTTWCSTYAAIRAGGEYFILISSGYKADEARAGMNVCLNNLSWKGIRLRYDTLKDPVQYSDGEKTDIRITNPMRKEVSAPVDTIEQADGSVPAGWQRCDIKDYGFMFFCPPGVFLLTADSPDGAWENVLDMKLYRHRAEQAVKLLTPEAREDGAEELEVTKKKREENARIAFCALTAQKRAYEDGSWLDIDPETVALIAPEGAVDWNLKINVGQAGEFPENQPASEKTLKPLMDSETKASGYCKRTISEQGFKTIGEQTWAYLYDSSAFLSRLLYTTCHHGRRIDVVLTITQPKRAEYMDLIPFAEDLLGHFRFSE